MMDGSIENRETLFCKFMNCNHCLACYEHDPFDKRNILCEKFGYEIPHGLIPAKFCDMFICMYPGECNDISLCINCRGYGYEEQ